MPSLQKHKKCHRRPEYDVETYCCCCTAREGSTVYVLRLESTEGLQHRFAFTREIEN